MKAYRSEQKPVEGKIRVAVVIDRGNIKPVWFEQMGKPSYDRVMIKQVCYVWDHQEGAARIINFSVTDGANTYCLSLNTKAFTWQLTTVETVPM